MQLLHTRATLNNKKKNNSMELKRNRFKCIQTPGPRALRLACDMSRFYEFLVLKCEYKYLVSHTASNAKQLLCMCHSSQRATAAASPSPEMCFSLCIALPSINLASMYIYVCIRVSWKCTYNIAMSLIKSNGSLANDKNRDRLPAHPILLTHPSVLQHDCAIGIEFGKASSRSPCCIFKIQFGRK